MFYDSHAFFTVNVPVFCLIVFIAHEIAAAITGFCYLICSATARTPFPRFIWRRFQTVTFYVMLARQKKQPQSKQ